MKESLMAQAAKARNSKADFKIRAVLLGGQILNPEQAARDVAELFASDIEGSLRGQAPELATHEIHALVSGVIERRLSTMMAFEDAGAPGAVPLSLPVANLKPSEVIEQRKVRMSIASLYRSVDANRFYCVVPSGQTNGREFPAWQFVEPVPDLLQHVLIALRGALRNEVHAFMVTAKEELNELSPAEVLAGTKFETRRSLHPSQARMLTLPATERQRRVLALIGGPGESMAD
jgi:hypothetical protein